MSFKDPWILFLIPLVLAAVYFFHSRTRQPVFRFPSGNLFLSLPHSLKPILAAQMIVLRLLAITFFLIALAGPQKILEEAQAKSEGIDIVLAIDISESMLAEDFEIEGRRANRLEVVKKVVSEFITERRGDRVGLVVFAGKAYTACPLTTDYDWLLFNLDRVETGLIDSSSTAVGSAIMSSLGRLKGSAAKSKIVILLTDGANNAGSVEPVTAAQVARSQGIKVYAIGAGSHEPVPMPVRDIWGRAGYRNVQMDFDEEALKKVAQETQAQYFKASDAETLKDIYREIDRLEKSEIEQAGYRECAPLFDRFLLFGLGLVVLEMILANTIFLRIP